MKSPANATQKEQQIRIICSIIGEANDWLRPAAAVLEIGCQTPLYPIAKAVGAAESSCGTILTKHRKLPERKQPLWHLPRKCKYWSRRPHEVGNFRNAFGNRSLARVLNSLVQSFPELAISPTTAPRQFPGTGIPVSISVPFRHFFFPGPDSDSSLLRCSEIMIRQSSISAVNGLRYLITYSGMQSRVIMHRRGGDGTKGLPHLRLCQSAKFGLRAVVKG